MFVLYKPEELPRLLLLNLPFSLPFISVFAAGVAVIVGVTVALVIVVALLPIAVFLLGLNVGLFLEANGLI